MKRTLALFGVLVLFCATLSGCVHYDDYDGGYHGHGPRWHSGYHHGGHYRSHGGYHRYNHHHHRYHRDYCD